MKDLRDTFRDMTPDEMREASREAEIAEWRVSNRFCGRCGGLPCHAARDPQRLADGAVLVAQQERVEVLLVVARREYGLEHFVGDIWIGHLLRTEFVGSDTAPTASHLESGGELKTHDVATVHRRACQSCSSPYPSWP